jgi:hypothetical protein
LPSKHRVIVHRDMKNPHIGTQISLSIWILFTIGFSHLVEVNSSLNVQSTFDGIALKILCITRPNKGTCKSIGARNATTRRHARARPRVAAVRRHTKADRRSLCVSSTCVSLACTSRSRLGRRTARHAACTRSLQRCPRLPRTHADAVAVPRALMHRGCLPMKWDALHAPRL